MVLFFIRVSRLLLDQQSQRWSWKLKRRLRSSIESPQERAQRISDETRTSAASLRFGGYPGLSSPFFPFPFIPVRSRRPRLINSYLISEARQPGNVSPVRAVSGGRISQSLRRYGAPAYYILLITTVCGRLFRFPILFVSPPLLPICRPDIGFNRVNNAALSARPVIKDRAPRAMSSGLVPFPPFLSLRCFSKGGRYPLVIVSVSR